MCFSEAENEKKFVALKFTTLLAMEEVLTPTNSATHKNTTQLLTKHALRARNINYIALYEEERFSPANSTVITMELFLCSLKQDNT